MILLPRKIQRFIAINVIIIVLVLFIYQFTKLFIDLATNNYVKNDYESLRNSRFNNANFQNSKVQADNSDTKYILSDSEFSSLFHKSINTPILYISRHEGTISNFKYISEYLNWNLTILSPESSSKQWNELLSCLMENNCGNKYEKFCREYNYVVISDIMLDVVPFLKIQNCKAKIITEITNRFDVFLKDNYKTKFHKLFKNAIETKKLIVVVNNPYEIYYLCRNGIHVPHYALIRSTGYPPKIQEYDESLYYHSEEPEKTIAIISRSKQDSMLSIPALKALNVPYEVLNTRYGGPKILSKFKALLYLPYQVSVMAMMENLRERIIYLLPSPSMFKRLLETYDEYTFTESSVFLDHSSESGDDNDISESKNPNKNTNNEVNNYIDSHIEGIEEYDKPIDEMEKRTEQKIKKKPIMENMLSKWVEWYREEFRDVFIYFEGFEELPTILNDLDNIEIINKKKDEIEKWVKDMERITISQWLTIINSPYDNPILNKLHTPVDDVCENQN